MRMKLGGYKRISRWLILCLVMGGECLATERATDSFVSFDSQPMPPDVTMVLQRQIDVAADAGGGRVVVPAGAAVADGGLSVREKDGAFSVVLEAKGSACGDASSTVQDGREHCTARVLASSPVTVVQSVSVVRGVTDDADVRLSFAVRPDGTKVWNRWSEVRDRRFRLEVGARADGAVELTMSSEADIDCTPCDRFLELVVAAGVLGAATPKAQVVTNWFAANGLTFDFNPMGGINAIGLRPVGEGWSHIDCVKGNAILVPQADGSVKIRLGARNGSPFGGYTGAKIVIRRGQDADFDTYHFRRRCHYADMLPARHLLAFGSPKRGARFAEGDVDYEKGFGWVKRAEQATPVVGYREGVYYSALSGRGEAAYRFGNLPPGWYFLTFAAGNYAGTPNNFSIRLSSSTNPNFSNPSNLSNFSNLCIAKGDLRRIVRAVHVSGGHLDVNFSGDWLVSSLALQPFVGDGEDFTLNRGFWLTKGYEPSVLFHSEDVPGPVVPGVSDTTDPLPVPGRECTGPRKELVRETELPPADHPGIAWTKTANLQRFQDQCAVFALGDKGMRADFIRRECTEKGVTAVMMSGLQNRFNVPRASENAVGVIRELVDEFHRQGIRVIDHIDTTLRTGGTSWRQIVEDPRGQLVERETGLISYQLCTANPSLKDLTYPYFRKIVAAGVDGFQIDENYMWPKGCLCHACCERFRRETGWEIPLDECSAHWDDIHTPFYRQLRDWRNAVCTGFLIDLRRHVKDLNDHLVLSAYPTWGGFISESCNVLGQDMGELMRVVNFFGLEMMSRSFLRNVRCELPGLHAMKTHGERCGAPVWNWYYNFDWQNDYAAWSVSMLAGCVPMLSRVAHPAGTPDYVSETGKYVARLGESVPFAEIGVYFSTCTRDAKDGVENWKERVFPAMEMMDELNIPYAVVPDFNISDERIKDYKVLYLCGADILTEREKAIFAAFEARGGRIVRGQASDREFDFNFRSAGRTYTYNPDPVREAAFRERLRKDLAGATWWTVDAPKQVFSSVRRLKDGTVAIQFFNQTGVRNKVGEVWPFYAPDPAYPPLATDVVFMLPAGFDDRIEATSPDFAGHRVLRSVRNADGTQTVTLPKELLKVYAFVEVLAK